MSENLYRKGNGFQAVVLSFVTFLVTISTDLPATEVSTYRVIESDKSIPGIISHVTIGLLRTGVGLPSGGEFGSAPPTDFRLGRVYIDGQSHPGLQAAVPGIERIFWFLTDDSRGRNASIQYDYSVALGGRRVHRRTVIQDEQVRLLTWFDGPSGPGGRLRHAELDVRAEEFPNGTKITICARVTVHTGLCRHRKQSRLRVVNRFVGKRIEELLDRGLESLEVETRRLSDEGCLLTVVNDLLRR